MRPFQEKKQKYVQVLRKQKRQEIMTQKRVWIQRPSLITQLPFMIDNSEWNQFEEKLDFMEEKDFQIMDESLVSYIRDKYSSALEKNPAKKLWEDVNKFNLIRIILRLKIENDDHLNTVLTLLEELSQKYLSQKSQLVSQTFFKMIKELAIYLSPLKNHERISNRLNSIVGNIKIYRAHYEGQIFDNEQLFSQYRRYYLYLLFHQIIDLTAFVCNKNIGELYCLILDSLEHKQKLQVGLSVNIMKKILRMNTIENKENQIFIKGLEVLLIDGLERAKEYVNTSHQLSIEEDHFNFSGHFLAKLLETVSNCDIESLSSLIELLGQLFQSSDNYIEAVSLIHCQKMIEVEDPSKTAQQMKGSQYTTFAEFFLHSLNNLILEIRYHLYWMLSNILGSERFFFSYGLQFIKGIYQGNQFFQEIENKSALIELNICILNFVCNLNLEQKALQTLMEIKLEENKPIKTSITHANSRYPDNCFIFCLDVTLDSIETLYNNLEENQGLIKFKDRDFIEMFDRSIYGLFSLLQIAKRGKEESVYKRVLFEMEKRNIHVYLEYFCSKEMHQKGEMMPLIEKLLKKLQTNKETL